MFQAVFITIVSVFSTNSPLKLNIEISSDLIFINSIKSLVGWDKPQHF